MLRRLYADNYRCFVNFELAPQQLNLLVGDNGSGKTAVFEVLEAVQDIVTFGTAVDEVLPTSTLTRWDTRDEQRFELEVELDGGTYLYVLEVKHDEKKETAIILREQVTFDGKPIFRYDERNVHLYDDRSFKLGTTFPADPKRSFLAILEERPENQRLMAFKRFVDSIWILRLQPGAMSSVSTKETRWLERDGSNIASWYRALAPEEPDAVEALRDDLRETFDGLQHFRLLASGGTAKDLVARFTAGTKAARSEYELTLDELSSGQRELFAIYAVLHIAVRHARLICFDEPDNFVALREIQPWLIKLTDAVEEQGAQLLLISHHPEVIDYLASASPFKFDRPSGSLARVRPLKIDLSEGLKASEALARGWADGQA